MTIIVRMIKANKTRIPLTALPHNDLTTQPPAYAARSPYPMILLLSPSVAGFQLSALSKNCLKLQGASNSPRGSTPASQSALRSPGPRLELVTHHPLLVTILFADPYALRP